MPDLPDPSGGGLFTTFLFENPLPLGGGLLVVGVILTIMGLRQGLVSTIRNGAIVLALAVLVFAVEAMVKTSGEHADRVTRAFVDAVVGSDLTGAEALLDANVSVGVGTNPGRNRDSFIGSLSGFAHQYNVESNRITSLKGFSSERELGVVRLRCRTEVEGGYGPVLTGWELRVGRTGDEWLIRRLSFLTVNGQPASSAYLP